jgi:uncharacterized protein DUF2760
MGNFALGFTALFRIWGDAQFADQVKQLIEGRAQPVAPPEPKPAAESRPLAEPKPVAEAPKKKEPARSDALSLLAVLQREARFVDFIKEPLAEYTDAQIGAAVRGVHKDCAAVLDRVFAVASLRAESEGADVEVPAGFDPAQFRLVGNVPDRAPIRGKLCHAGWRATKCDVPQWSGRDESALVIAPCEVELK